MAGGKAAGVAIVGGALLFGAGFLLGRWTTEPVLPGRDGGDAQGGPGSGTASVPTTAAGGAQGAGSRPDRAAPTTASAAAESGDPAGAVVAAAPVGDGGGGAQGAPGAGIPGKRVTDAVGAGGGGAPAGGGLMAPPARGADAPGRTAPPPAYALPEKIRGRLLDALSLRPVPGAEVSLLWELGDGTMSGGVDTAELDAEGCFSFEPLESMRGNVAWVLKEHRERDRKFKSEADVLADVNYTLRTSAKGYETEEIGDPGPALEIRIQPQGRDRLTGSIRVDARWPDGVRFAGRLLVAVGSHDRPGFSQWALPDPDGTFLLAGIEPGKWDLRVAGRNHSGEGRIVPEAGEARITLRVPRQGVGEPEDTPKGEPREVEVSCAGRSPAPYSFVRAEVPSGAFFRSEVVASVARFPALPAGKWTFVLQSAEHAEVRFSAEVPAGAGRLSLSFPEPAAETAAPK